MNCFLEQMDYGWPEVFIRLGRYGDLILLLPAWKAMHERTGVPRVVITANQFVDVLEGVSYVTPVGLDVDFYHGVSAAKAYAAQVYGDYHSIECLNHHLDLAIPPCPNYMTYLWRSIGFADADMLDLPVVFDRRDHGREAALARIYQGWKPHLPLLLHNFHGNTSPCPAHPEIMKVIQSAAQWFNVVDLSKIKAHRIYDLLGLMDRAAGLITIDTATLHLAGASTVPYIGLTQDGRGASVCKGKNCVLSLSYQEAGAKGGMIRQVLEQWASRTPPPVPPPDWKEPAMRGGGGAVLRV